MAAEEITLDELLGAFKDAGFTGDADAPGKTVRELTDLWHCTANKAVQIIQQAKTAGMLRVGKRTSERIDGGACRVPVYSFVFSPKAPARKKK